MDTLVLSASYEPVDRVSWEKAITWVVQGRAEVIIGYTERFIRTVTQVFELPSVIRLLNLVGEKVRKFRKRGVKFSRKNIWLRDGGQCQYCEVKLSVNEFTYDHVIPRDQGGLTKWDNIVCACRRCNQRKANKTPAQAKMKLLKQPGIPTSLKGADTLDPFKGTMPESWRDFLVGYGYWNEELEA